MLKELFEKYWIKHFTVDELLGCSNTKKYKESDIPKQILENIIPTIRILDEVRDELNKPIYLNCGYRDDKHNLLAGGEKNSLHKKFNALDFRVNCSFAELKELYQHINYLDQVKHFNFLPKTGSMGLGLYSTFIHIDTRAILNMKSPARWTIL